MKRIKMVLYGEPGVGKSVFACHAPKPFFICTDGNYEWLDEFGAKEEDHVNVSSWTEIKNCVDHPEKFDKYETVVLDLIEDGFKWCESEFCVRNKIEHVSDLGYGKGYDTTRNEFFITISKLLALDKNVILIMHGLTAVEKDRRGVEHTKHIPTSRIPDKVLDMIEGRVRYFLRAYIKDEEQADGTVKKRRYLSLVPKPNEFGIIRGVNENNIPQDINLDWNEFTKAIGYDTKEEVVEQEEKPVIKRQRKKTEEKVETVKTVETQIDTTPVDAEVPIVEKATKETPIVDVVKEVVEAPKTLSNEDKLAAIRAKLAALNKK